MILTESQMKVANPEGEVLRVFLKAIDLLGGIRELIHKRNLTWLPSMLQAAYIVVMNSHGKSADEIASELGISTQSVRNTLRADVEALKKRIQKDELDQENEEKRTHIAGALAKWAYEEIKAGREHIPFLAELYEEFSRALDIEWPIEVLVRIRGLRFPVTKQQLRQRFSDLKRIKNMDTEQVVEQLPEQIASPAELLKSIKEIVG